MSNQNPKPGFRLIKGEGKPRPITEAYKVRFRCPNAPKCKQWIRHARTIQPEPTDPVGAKRIAFDCPRCGDSFAGLHNPNGGPDDAAAALTGRAAALLPPAANKPGPVVIVTVEEWAASRGVTNPETIRELRAMVRAVGNEHGNFRFKMPDPEPEEGAAPIKPTSTSIDDRPLVKCGACDATGPLAERHGDPPHVIYVDTPPGRPDPIAIAKMHARKAAGEVIPMAEFASALGIRDAATIAWMARATDTMNAEGFARVPRTPLKEVPPLSPEAGTPDRVFCIQCGSIHDAPACGDQAL